MRLNDELKSHAAQVEAANKELESFSYSVSHDLRAPLRAIAGFSHMLEEDYGARLDEEGRRLIRVVCDNAHKMGQLIDDLLAFSRVGRNPIAAARIDMEALVRSALHDIGEPATGARAQIEIKPLPEGWGDPALIKQVWVNLLSNAIKFSANRDEPRIEVSAFDDRSDTVYCVKDNGAGFDMRYYDKLFGVFQRLHSADQFPGTGVGLAIVQRVVARHDGRVWAEG